MVCSRRESAKSTTVFMWLCLHFVYGLNAARYQTLSSQFCKAHPRGTQTMGKPVQGSETRHGSGVFWLDGISRAALRVPLFSVWFGRGKIAAELRLGGGRKTRLLHLIGHLCFS
ncbi:hypothetical protein V8C34DRAFT_290308 [Trichoderma compactum]